MFILFYHLLILNSQNLDIYNFGVIFQAIFQRYPRPEKEYQSFSLIFNDRSLDLVSVFLWSILFS